MRKPYWLATTLSLSLGVSLLAGCGHTPTQTTTGVNTGDATSADFNSPLAAQEGAMPSAAPSGAPAAMPSAAPAPSAMPSGAPAATPSGMPTAPGGTAPGGQPGGQPGGPGGPGGLVPGIGGSGVIGPIAGGLTPVVGTGGAPFVFGANSLVAFQSNRATGGGGPCNFDIFVYDALAQTVLAMPAVNTPFNETNPRLSANGQWLVYQTDQFGTDDIFLFNVANQLINTLDTLNTPIFNEREADVSDDGALLVYVQDSNLHHLWRHRHWDRDHERGLKEDCFFHGGADQLRIFDLRNGSNYLVPVANRGLTDINWPTISGNGAVIAYGASALGGDSDVFVYSLPDAAQLTPPFINTPADEYNPDLSVTGDRILFVSNRRGSQDIYMVDLRSGFTDNLVLANTDAIEDEPRFIGPASAQIVFQSNRAGNWRIFAYDLASGLLDTLPIANECCSNTMLRNVFPQPGPGIPGGGTPVGGNGVIDGPESAGSHNVVAKDGRGKDGRH